nr:242_t:CDS:10 [Entrophospora candida]
MATYGERALKFRNETARKLFEVVERKKTNLSLALDVTTKKQFLEVVDKVGQYICCLKTHIDVITDFDQDLIDQLQKLKAKHDFLIFEDRKFADIGNTVKLQYSKGIYKIVEWADITNAHLLPGEGIVLGLKEVGLPLGRGLLLIAKMSSKGNLATGSYTKETIRMAHNHDDFVIGFIYANSHPPSGSSRVGLDVSKDKMGQQYSTPEEVITNGKTDIIIVGRGIYASGKDMVDEAKRYRDAGWNAYLDKLRRSGKDQMNFFRSLTSIVPPIAENTIRKTTKYGGKYTVTLIPGDGIGPEIAESVKTVFKEAKVPIEWEQYNVTGYTEDSDLLFQQSMESLRRNKVALKGVIYTSTKKDDHPSFNVAMRKDLDIYASLVLIKNIKGYPTRHKDVDFVIIRENTEGEYAGKLGDGLFLNTCRKIAEDYKPLGIEFNDMIVDNCSMQLVSKPQQFDVMVMPNLYGAIVSNIGAALVGGPGVVPGANIGKEYALFEPGARHVGRDIQGDNKANPTAFILSGVLLLRHLGLDDDANRIYNAVIKAILHGSAKTRDMGGNSTTTEFTREVISNL